MTAFPGRAALQPERTALAWQRTAVTATVAILPLVLVSAREGAWLTTVLGSLAAVVAGVLLIGVHRRVAQLLDDHTTVSPFDPMLRVAVVASLTALVGVGTALMLFLR